MEIFLLTIPFAISVRYLAIIESVMIMFAVVPAARILQDAGLFRKRRRGAATLCRPARSVYFFSNSFTAASIC